jgi:hypothetical protein
MNIPEDKEHLRHILDQGEYTAYHQTQHNGLWAWIKKAFLKLWDLLPPLHLSNGAGKTITYLLALSVLGLLVWAIYWFVKQIVRQGRYKKKLVLTDAELMWVWRDYMVKAEQLHAAGTWREGVRYVFLALLFYMQERKWVSIEKWKTNWEYSEELKRNHGEWLPFFQSSAKLFDRIWYGKEFIDEAGLLLFLEEVREIIRDSEGGSHAAVE